MTEDEIKQDFDTFVETSIKQRPNAGEGILLIQNIAKENDYNKFILKMCKKFIQKIIECKTPDEVEKMVVAAQKMSKISEPIKFKEKLKAPLLNSFNIYFWIFALLTNCYWAYQEFSKESTSLPWLLAAILLIIYSLFMIKTSVKMKKETK